MPAPRLGHTAVSLSDGRILIHGGTGLASYVNDTLLVLDTRVTPWQYSTLDLTRTSLSTPNRAWHTATVIAENVIVFAYGLDTDTKQTSKEIFFLVANDADEWTWSQKNPLVGTIQSRSEIEGGDEGVTATDLEVTAVVASIPSESQGVVQAAQHFLNNTAVKVANPKATELETPPNGNDPSMGSVVSPSATLQSPSSSSSKVTTHSSNTSAGRQQSSEMPSAGSNQNSSNDDTDSHSSSTSPHSKIIAGAVSGVFVLALAAGLAGLYFRKRAAEAEAVAGQDAEPYDGMPPISEMLYTRRAPRRMLSLGSTASLRSERSAIRLVGTTPGVTATGQAEDEEEDAYDPLSEKEALDTINEFGKLSSAPASEKPLPRPVVAHTISTASLVSNESRASVASYPFLTSLPVLTANSHKSNETMHRNDLVNGNGITRTLLRSHTMTSASSKSSYSNDGYQNENLSLPESAYNMVRSVPLPPKEVPMDRTADSNPFADFEEVRMSSLIGVVMQNIPLMSLAD